MATKTINVVRDTGCDRGFTFLDSWGVPVDITAYAIELVVFHPVAKTVIFELAGTIVTGASGTFKFVLTPEHTCLAAGTYYGNIRFWSGGAPAAGTPPTESWDASFVISDTVKTLP